MDPKTLQIIIPVLVILPILYFRMQRAMKPQRLKPPMLLVRPAIIIVIAMLVLGAAPPAAQSLPWFGFAAVIGAGAGWYWGKLTHLELHPENGTVMSKGSLAGVVVLVVLVLFRYGVRAGAVMEGQAADVALFTDLSIVFSALLFSARGAEIFLRAQRLLKSSNP